MAEKTEQPTPKKIREAREKGQVAISKDFASAVLLVAVSAFLLQRVGVFHETFELTIDEVVQAIMSSQQTALIILQHAIVQMMSHLLLPLLGLVFVIGLLAYIGQTGPVFAPKAIKMDIKRLNPVENGKNMFGKRKLLEFAMNVLKVVFMTVLLYKVIDHLLPVLLIAPSCGMRCVQSVLFDSYWLLMFYACLCFVIVGAADIIIKRKLHTKDLMMTKDEVKREFKEMEGDPVIKSKRRQMAQEMAMNDMTQKVKKASVIVTNPTHRAVALFYDKESGKLPVVMAKGEDHLARLIIKTAEQEGIPVMRNVPLAHSLYDEVPVDHYIPTHLIEAVAGVLRWLQQLKQREQAGG